MTEREPDDTPKPSDASHDRAARVPGAYYYDDATGYEVYHPDDNGDGEDGEAADESEG